MGLFSIEFLILFSCGLVLNCLFPQIKKFLIFCINVMFYIYAGWEGFLLFNIYIVITYCFLYKTTRKYVWLAVVEAIPLLLFKYFFRWVNIGSCSIIAPLGLSFFTFQAISILVDFNRGKCQRPSFADYYVYMSLFTTITAGPINRYHLLEQIHKNEPTNPAKIEIGFRYMINGLFLKLLIAERMKLLVDSVYGNIKNMNGLAIAIASICFSIEIYCDFAGYSLIAQGLSKCFNLDVVQNFDAPYSAVSVTDFWRRWHISLSSWFRDYIYIPLGGNRCTWPKQIVNTMITFTLSGIWHGSTANYLIWGATHGIALCLEKKIQIRANKIVKKILFLTYINLTWILFRIENINDLIASFRKLFFDFVPSIFSIDSFNEALAFLYSLNTTIPNLLACVIAIILFALWSVLRFDNVRYGSPVISFIILLLTLIFGVTGNAGDFIYASY